MERIVRVTQLRAAEERLAVVWVQRPAVAQALWQVRVGDEVAPKSDQVGISGLKDRVGRITGEAARSDKGAFVVLADKLGCQRILVPALVLDDTEDAWLDQMQIGEVQFVQFVRDI